MTVSLYAQQGIYFIFFLEDALVCAHGRVQWSINREKRALNPDQVIYKCSRSGWNEKAAVSEAGFQIVFKD